MENTTVLAIIALALALGLMAGVLAVAPNTANAVSDHAVKACAKTEDRPGHNHIPFCVI